MPRQKDNELLLCHFSETELQAMDLLQEGASIDPDTGLREYSKLARIIEIPEVQEGMMKTFEEVSLNKDEYDVKKINQEAHKFLPDLEKIPSDQEFASIERTGRHGDKYLALVPKNLVKLLIHLNGGYHINPKTGLLEFFFGGIFKSIVSAVVPSFIGGFFGLKDRKEKVKQEENMYRAENARVEREKRAQGFYLQHTPNVGSKKWVRNPNWTLTNGESYYLPNPVDTSTGAEYDYRKTLGKVQRGVNADAQRKHNLGQLSFELGSIEDPTPVSTYVPMSPMRRLGYHKMLEAVGGPHAVKKLYDRVPDKDKEHSMWRPFYKEGGAVKETPLRSYIKSSGIYGKGKGQDDTIKTSLPSGSYIIDATTTAHLGDGSSSAGIKALEGMAHKIKKEYPSSFVKKVEHQLRKTQRSTPVYLSHEEFKFDPVTVALAGGGSLEAGVTKFRQMVHNVRQHKASKGLELPPKAKDPLAYLPS